MTTVNNSNAVVVSEPERFAKNAEIMANAVYDSIKMLYDRGYKTIDPIMVQLACNVIVAFDKNYLIQGFIEGSHEKCWDRIKVRDELFFIENAGGIFKNLPTENVNLFKDLFLTKDTNGNCVISQEVKNMLWGLFDAMIKISIKYIHKGKAPYSCESDGSIQCFYSAQFFDEVDISRHAKTWGVQLDFPQKY